MNTAQLSIALEVMSFLFVTTDLYGEERLKILENNAKQRLQKAFKKLASKNYFTKEWLKDEYNNFLAFGEVAYWIIGIVGFCIWFPTFFYLGKILEQFIYPLIEVGQNFLQFIITPFALFASVSNIIVLFLILTGIPFVFVLIFDLIQVFLIRKLITLFKKSNVKGIGIYIGTALFLVSKIIIFGSAK